MKDIATFQETMKGADRARYASPPTIECKQCSLKAWFLTAYAIKDLLTDLQFPPELALVTAHTVHDPGDVLEVGLEFILKQMNIRSLSNYFNDCFKNTG